MESLNLQVEDSYYPALLELLKNLPKNKIQLQEIDNENPLTFEQANCTLKKMMSCINVCHDSIINAGTDFTIA